MFSLSLRDVELILAERGITVTHESVRQWCLKFGGDFARKLRRRRPKPGETWHLDERFCQGSRQVAHLAPQGGAGRLRLRARRGEGRRWTVWPAARPR